MSKRMRLAKGLARVVGLRVRRAGLENRFDGMTDSLDLLRRRGYRPRLIIDGGANVGEWTRLAARVFPDAEFHLIEPQPVCVEALRRLQGPGRYVHAAALTRPGVRSVTMAGMTGDSANTGAWVVAGAASSEASTLSAVTLDDLFEGRMTVQDRTLLKMDLEGHEMAALEGAASVLPRIEVIVSEVQFFDIERQGCPTFSDLAYWLRARNFDLYDFAALASRPRDGRLRMGDAVFVRRDSPLLADVSWA